jgi:hypothetical protein
MTLLSGGCERDLQDPVAAGRQQHQVSWFTMSSFLTSTFPISYLKVFDVVAQLIVINFVTVKNLPKIPLAAVVLYISLFSIKPLLNAIGIINKDPQNV